MTDSPTIAQPSSPSLTRTELIKSRKVQPKSGCLHLGQDHVIRPLVKPGTFSKLVLARSRRWTIPVEACAIVGVIP